MLSFISPHSLQKQKDKKSRHALNNWISLEQWVIFMGQDADAVLFACAFNSKIAVLLNQRTSNLACQFHTRTSFYYVEVFKRISFFFAQKQSQRYSLSCEYIKKKNFSQFFPVRVLTVSHVIWFSSNVLE